MMLNRSEMNTEPRPSDSASISHWSRMEGVLRQYEYRLGRAAAYTSPGNVTDLLGPLPDRLAATERWQAAAGAIEAYRSRWNVTGTATIGSEPTDPEQQEHWRTTVATVGAAGFLNDGRSPGNESEREGLASRWEAMRQADLARHEMAVDHTLSDDDDDRHRRRSRDRDNDLSRDVGFGR